MRATAILLTLLMGCALDAEVDESAWYEEAFTEMDDGKADNAGCSGVRVPDQSGFAKRIAITFDDGPVATTSEVLAILRRHDVPATFFVNGSKITSTTRDIAADIVADPLFILGNHTYSHPNMKNVSVDKAASEIDRTADAIASVGGSPSFFRFPYGASSCTTANMVRERGYHVTGWHIDSADWCFAAGGGYCSESTFRYVPDQFRGDMRGFVLSQARSRNGGVLLFHDIHRNTINNLEDIIVALIDEGFTFTSLDDVDTFPLLNGVAPQPGGFIGDPCASDSDCRFVGGFCLPAAEIPGGFCTKSCTSTCPDRDGYATSRCVATPDEFGATSNLCTISCSADQPCRDELTCQPLLGPSGSERDVCWR